MIPGVHVSGMYVCVCVCVRVCVRVCVCVCVIEGVVRVRWCEDTHYLSMFKFCYF